MHTSTERAVAAENQKAESTRRLRVLVCVPRYLPGFKSGGPIRSVSNMVTHLSPHFEFHVVTRDRDAADKSSYPGIAPGYWHQVGEAQVLYCSSVRPQVLRRAYEETRPDAVVLNSFHDTFTVAMLLLRRIGVFGRTPFILAPRGEFSQGALRVKRWKKTTYRSFAKVLGLYSNLYWQVTTEYERADLLRISPAWRIKTHSIHITHGISDALQALGRYRQKQPGAVKLVFIARISEMKNLDFLLQILHEVSGAVEINLFGPIAEKDIVYWKRCSDMLDKLPANICAKYHGPVDHANVPQIMRDHHFFVLPTRGENFCHSAVESLINGTPVLLSDQTPWRNLQESGAGFDINLNDRSAWISALQACIDMDDGIYSGYHQGALRYSQRFSVTQAVEEHIAMFDAALNPEHRSDAGDQSQRWRLRA